MIGLTHRCQVHQTNNVRVFQHENLAEIMVKRFYRKTIDTYVGI